LSRVFLSYSRKDAELAPLPALHRMPYRSMDDRFVSDASVLLAIAVRR
jgi:hypothetical protein